MKTKVRKRVTHIVFDDENEFVNYFGDPHPPIVKEWRNGQEGDWVLADDGGIVQILRRGELPHPHDRKNYSLSKGWVRTIVGTFRIAQNVKMDTDFSKHPQPYTFSNKSREEQQYNWKIKPNLSKRERIFLVALQTGKTLQAAYEEAFGPKVNWREPALALIKLERIRKELNKNLEEIADKLGCSYEYIMAGFMKLAEEADSDKTKLDSLKELKDWLAAKEETKEITRGEVTAFQPFTGDELLAIEAEKVEIE